MIIKTKGGKYPQYKELPIGFYLFIAVSAVFMVWNIVRFIVGAISSGLF